jgi:hypothetical protein
LRKIIEIRGDVFIALSIADAAVDAPNNPLENFRSIEHAWELSDKMVTEFSGANAVSKRSIASCEDVPRVFLEFAQFTPFSPVGTTGPSLRRSIRRLWMLYGQPEFVFPRQQIERVFCQGNADTGRSTIVFELTEEGGKKWQKISGLVGRGTVVAVVDNEVFAWIRFSTRGGFRDNKIEFAPKLEREYLEVICAVVNGGGIGLRLKPR